MAVQAPDPAVPEIMGLSGNPGKCSIEEVEE